MCTRKRHNLRDVTIKESVGQRIMIFTIKEGCCTARILSSISQLRKGAACAYIVFNFTIKEQVMCSVNLECNVRVRTPDTDWTTDY